MFLPARRLLVGVVLLLLIVLVRRSDVDALSLSDNGASGISSGHPAHDISIDDKIGTSAGSIGGLQGPGTNVNATQPSTVVEGESKLDTTASNISPSIASTATSTVEATSEGLAATTSGSVAGESPLLADSPHQDDTSKYYAPSSTQPPSSTLSATSIDTPSVAVVDSHPDPYINSLLLKYKGRFCCCNSPLYPNCDIFLCGTLHVAQSSSDMVQEVVQGLRPKYVVLELCESRVDSLSEWEEEDPQNAAPPVRFRDIIRVSWVEKSFQTFGMGLLTW
jgi:hypothetical protein